MDCNISGCGIVLKYRNMAQFAKLSNKGKRIFFSDTNTVQIASSYF